MRYDVKKFLFMGLEEEKELFFKRAQDAGIIHFIHPSGKKGRVETEEVRDIVKGIKVVLGLPVEPQVEPANDQPGLTLAREAKGLKTKIDALAEEERKLNLEISRVAIFGSFSKEDIAAIEQQGNRKIQFYCAKQGFADSPDLPEEAIYVGTDNGLDYFAAVNKEPRQYPRMIEMIIDRPWNELKTRLKEVLREKEVLENRLKQYAKYNRYLHKSLVDTLNEVHLANANDCISKPLEGQELFAVEGWVPEHKMEELDALVKGMNIYVEQIEIEPLDVVPTYLENTGASRIGEDLVHIYDTPSITDKDPSLWVLLFFSLFFAMIIGDGGYGLVLLLIALYIRRKHTKLSSTKQRVLDLATILAFSCIVWGVLTTSFFGFSFAPDNPMRKLSPLSWAVEKKAEYHLDRKDTVYQHWITKFPQAADAKTAKEFLLAASQDNGRGGTDYVAFSKFADNIMMELALLIGVIHVILSMCRNITRNWSYVGWILLIIGGYLYAPVFLDAVTMPNYIFGIDPQTDAKNGLYLIYAGLAIAVLIALFRQKLMGLLEATVVIQIFGDILSYMRLYALGLSGSLLTATIIDLAASVPVVFGIVILIFGHTMNLGLSVMGGVIHGLRLNFLEWYHYSFEGGGSMFKALKKELFE
jgi:V/A-type H+-transporting ATPase subunit I